MREKRIIPTPTIPTAEIKRLIRSPIQFKCTLKICPKWAISIAFNDWIICMISISVCALLRAYFYGTPWKRTSFLNFYGKSLTLITAIFSSKDFRAQGRTDRASRTDYTVKSATRLARSRRTPRGCWYIPACTANRSDGTYRYALKGVFGKIRSDA